jgi:superfamily II DNA or RNA helicase
MTITLRPYQDNCLNDLRASYRAGHRAPLLVAPTGSGKTVIFCRVVKGRVAKGGSPMILAHRAELVDQIDKSLRADGIVPGIIAAGYPESPGALVQIASVFSLVRRLERTPAPDLIVVDEAHHAINKTTWGQVLGHWPRARILGVTATPTRLSGEGLDDIFDDMVLGPSIQELVDLGSLAPLTVYAPPGPDLSGVGKRMGDFVKSELMGAMLRSTVVGDAVDHYRRLAHGKPALAFCVSIQHANEVAKKFRDGGYTSVCIDGSLAPHLRREVVRDFTAGAINVLTTVDLVTEGFDVPRCEVGIWLRPTCSTVVYLQGCGRVMRPYPGKTRGIILDHAGNTHRHGLPSDDRQWSLAGADFSRGDRGPTGVPAVRTCARCFAAAPAGVSQCPECGLVFPVKRKVREVEGELEEYDAERSKGQKRNVGRNPANDLAGLVELGKLRGYKEPEKWANHVLGARQRKKSETARHFDHGQKIPN